jgi:hypothetical protein
MQAVLDAMDRQVRGGSAGGESGKSPGSFVRRPDATRSLHAEPHDQQHRGIRSLANRVVGDLYVADAGALLGPARHLATSRRGEWAAGPGRPALETTTIDGNPRRDPCTTSCPTPTTLRTDRYSPARPQRCVARMAAGPPTARSRRSWRCRPASVGPLRRRRLRRLGPERPGHAPDSGERGRLGLSGTTRRDTPVAATWLVPRPRARGRGISHLGSARRQPYPDPRDPHREAVVARAKEVRVAP